MRRGQRTLVARTAPLFFDVGQTIDQHDGPATTLYPEAQGDLKDGSLRFASPCDPRADPLGQAVQFGSLSGPPEVHRRFAWQERPACHRQQRDMASVAPIRTAVAPWNDTLGSPRLPRDLVDEGQAIGRDCTARLMPENQLVARQ